MLVAGCKSTPTPSAPAGHLPPDNKPAERVVNHARLASAHAHFAAGVLADANGDMSEAVAEFQKALADDPADETLLLNVTERLLRFKQPEKALEMLIAATVDGEASGEVHNRLGSVQALLGHNDEALNAYRLAIQKSPRYFEAQQNLFLHLLAAKQPEEALKVLEAAGRLEELNARFLVGLASLYQNYLRQYPTQRDAIKPGLLGVLTRAEALKPADPLTRVQMADALYSLGEQKRASELYLGLLEHIGDFPLMLESVRAKLADIFIRSDDRARAREQLEAISRDDPSNVQVHYFLASLAYDDKRWSDAIEHLRKALVLNPNFEQAYHDLAAAQLAADDAGSALETLARARGKFAQSFLGEYLTALAESRSKNYVQAIKRYTAAEVIARATEPKRLNADFYFEIGIAHERTGDRQEAARYFELALKLNPDFPEVQNYLGYMWAEQGENLERARELIAAALKAEPKSAAYLDSMGWVLFKLNQSEAALEYLLQAVKENEKPDATIYDHLGDVYATLGQMEKAREAWEKSLAVEDAEAVRKKLNPPKSP